MLPPRQRQARPDSERVMAVTGIMQTGLDDLAGAGKGMSRASHILPPVRFVITAAQFD